MTPHRPRSLGEDGWACTGCKVRSASGDALAAHCMVAAGTSRLIVRAEAAALACISPKTWNAYEHRNQGGIPQPVDRVGRTPRYSRAAVMRWVNRRA